MKLLPSLRQKLAVGYLLWLVIVFSLGLVGYKGLMDVEEMVLAGTVVSDLLDTALEVRRFEKNYFLYGDEASYRELKRYLGHLHSILQGQWEAILPYAKAEGLSRLRADIRQYEELLEAVLTLRGREAQELWEPRLRQKGKEIVTAAERIARLERQAVQEAVRATRRNLLVSGVFLVLFVLLFGVISFRMLIRPLGAMEAHMRRVAEGHFAPLPISSDHREVQSLHRAFNRMLRELQWRQQHLIQREKLASLGTLLFGVVHELNNPLSNISTSCQILKEELLEADLQFKQTLLKQIEDETDRARDIVRSILDFSRAGHRQEAALAHIVAESIRLLKAELPPKVELQVEVPPDIVLFVDKQKLRQVFLNLLKNAAEAMPQGGKVLVQAERKGAQVLIRVSDTGAGMEPEVAEKVFDPFFTTKDRKKGYGLGLFVVHNIIQEHGGDISVESSPGRGTTFTISLEAKEDAPRQDTHS